MKHCKICGGPVFKLGALGLRMHGRCRDCGMQWSWLVRRRNKPEQHRERIAEDTARMPAAIAGVMG